MVLVLERAHQEQMPRRCTIVSSVADWFILGGSRVVTPRSRKAGGSGRPQARQEYASAFSSASSSAVASIFFLENSSMGSPAPTSQTPGQQRAEADWNSNFFFSFFFWVCGEIKAMISNLSRRKLIRKNGATQIN